MKPCPEPTLSPIWSPGEAVQVRAALDALMATVKPLPQERYDEVSAIFRPAVMKIQAERRVARRSI